MNVKTDHDMRDQVITDHLPLVVFEARRMAERLPPMVDFDDLVSSGTIGLIEAVERFDPSRDVKFRTYAAYRIRGAMLDFLRANDCLPRSAREFLRDLSRASESFITAFGRPPSFVELAELLHRTPDELGKKMASLSFGPVVELMSDTDQEMDTVDMLKGESTMQGMDAMERRDALMRAIEANLNEREKLILQLYYWEDLNLREIANVFEICESRVSQILARARHKMHVKLKRNELFSTAA